jgi:hypothetical protein
VMIGRWSVVDKGMWGSYNRNPKVVEDEDGGNK